MNDLYTSYKLHLSKAQKVLELLKKQGDDINDKLKLNESSAILHKKLRTVHLDIKITEHEIDRTEYNFREDDAKNISILN